MEFSRQKYWSGLPIPSLVDLSNSGIKLGSPALQVDSLPAELLGKPMKEKKTIIVNNEKQELKTIKAKEYVAESSPGDLRVP